MENVSMIGLDPREVQWLRLTISLLRHPDPVAGEVTRQALQYLESRYPEDAAARANRLSRAAG